MIVVFEFASPPFQWRPFLFRATYGGKPTWRWGWLGFSMSFYRVDGLHKFFDLAEDTKWSGA